MVVLLNTSLGDFQPIRIALRQMYGIGASKAGEICAHMGFSDNCRVGDLNAGQRDALGQLLRHRYSVENERLSVVGRQARRLVSISSWRGLRLAQGLPCRGQRTHGNARTARRLNAYRVKNK
jgi:small subunit ribosomal protein S13